MTINASISEMLRQQLRDLDRDRYLADLFIHSNHRDSLIALHVFNAEISRIRDVVSEAMPGEIRLTWWREVLEGQRAAEANGNPVALQLLEVISQNSISAPALVQMTETRIFDLYNDPMPDRATFEGYAGETHSMLFQLGAQILADENSTKNDPDMIKDEAKAISTCAGHGGVAQLAVEVLSKLVLHRSRGQCYVPGDLLAAAGTSHEQFLRERDKRIDETVMSAMLAFSREHLKLAFDALPNIAPAQRSAFLPLYLCEPRLAKMERLGHRIVNEPFELQHDLPQWRRQWHLWRGARSL